MKPKLLVSALILLPVLAVAAPKKPPKSSVVRFFLAGGQLTAEESYVKYDPKARYFLVATGDCDGVSVDLILTPQPSTSGMGITQDDKKLALAKTTRRTTLPRLRDGKGVNIGDTPQQVEQKLGALPSQVSPRHEFNGRDWVYLAAVPLKRKHKYSSSTLQNYRATYTFRDGKLWAIHYNLQDPHGC